MTDGNVTLNVSVDPLVAYPVGSIYMSVNSTNPSQLFGGTWVALNEGRVLIGAGTSYPAGTTGGEATHTLTKSEMPSHSHSGSTGSSGYHSHSGSTDSDGSHYHYISNGDNGNVEDGIISSSNYMKYKTYTYGYDCGYALCGTSTYPTLGKTSSSSSHSHSVSINSGGSHTHDVSIGSAGSGSAHNNMQPYLSVYMWKRTA